MIPAMSVAARGAFRIVSDPAGSRRDVRTFTVKGRLKPGVTVAQADAEMATLASGLAAAYPGTNRNHSVIIRTEVQARIAQSPPNAFFVRGRC